MPIQESIKESINWGYRHDRSQLKARHEFCMIIKTLFGCSPFMLPLFVVVCNLPTSECAKYQLPDHMNHKH